MSEEKQIEELANSFYEAITHLLSLPTCRVLAKDVIGLGYRKQREGEWIFKEYGEDTYTNLTRIYECSLCGRTIECLNEADEPYCHCGAKMKGGE